jgi:hypothetical protein
MRTHLRSRRRILFSRCAVFTLLLSLFLPGTARAQFNGSISGTISDPTGAVIPGAKITLQNEATQTTRDTTSSDQGFYQFGELPPGSYTITVTATNFKTQSFSNIHR